MESEELKKLKKQLFEARLAYEYAKKERNEEKIDSTYEAYQDVRNQMKHEIRIEIEKENEHVRH